MEEFQAALAEVDAALNMGSQWNALVAMAKALHALATTLEEGQ